MILQWRALFILSSSARALDTNQLANTGKVDTWQEHHMKIEHGVDSFDARAFFVLHDSDNSKTWTRDDILNLYGINKQKTVGDGSGMGTSEESTDITPEVQEKVYQSILDLLDRNGDGKISIDEWRMFYDGGGKLPDFGLGPGHHGDYEHEYEVHHWKQFHADSDPDVNIQHPEDVEHERLYHQNEHHDDGWNDHDPTWVRVDRIPPKFRKE